MVRSGIAEGQRKEVRRKKYSSRLLKAKRFLMYEKAIRKRICFLERLSAERAQRIAELEKPFLLRVLEKLFVRKK